MGRPADDLEAFLDVMLAALRVLEGLDESAGWGDVRPGFGEDWVKAAEARVGFDFPPQLRAYFALGSGVILPDLMERLDLDLLANDLVNHQDFTVQQYLVGVEEAVPAELRERSLEATPRRVVGFAASTDYILRVECDGPFTGGVFLESWMSGYYGWIAPDLAAYFRRVVRLGELGLLEHRPPGFWTKQDEFTRRVNEQTGVVSGVVEGWLFRHCLVDIDEISPDYVQHFGWRW